tara:strand:- start:602 stop:1078 length:477 start_codon:yes stop_codon:yes gene_type:complete
MRVKYSFTTDLKDVPSGVHFHLSRYLGEHSIDSNLKSLMDLTVKDEPNFSLIHKNISNLREQLGKLDLLLSETEIILTACENYERAPNIVPAQEQDTPEYETRPEEIPENRAEQSESIRAKQQRVEQNLAQMSAMANTLNNMRSSQPWEHLNEEGNSE